MVLGMLFENFKNYYILRYVIYEFLKKVLGVPQPTCLVRVHCARGVYGSVTNSSNGLNFIKKRAKNGRFLSKKTGKKRAKLKNVMKKNGRFRVFLYPLS